MGVWPWFCVSAGEGLLVFWVLGFGVSIADSTVMPLLFSERYGHQKFLQVGKFRLKLMRARKA